MTRPIASVTVWKMIRDSRSRFHTKNAMAGCAGRFPQLDHEPCGLAKTILERAHSEERAITARQHSHHSKPD